MLRLHPIPDVERDCFDCETRLVARDWIIPGMRALADLACEGCGKEYFGDLPIGFGATYPYLIEKASGRVRSAGREAKWFGFLLRRAYRRRVSKPLEITTIRNREVKRPLLLNCLDLMYGHSLLKLLNAQAHIDHDRELDLIVIVPEKLLWMVPEGAAEIWSVRMSLSDGWQWNDWLAKELRSRIEASGECLLSPTHTRPPHATWDIERFTSVQPFKHNEQPTVTFIWREDRLWSRAPSSAAIWWLAMRFPGLFGTSRSKIERQAGLVTELARLLRQRRSDVQFIVAGLGRTGALPSWIIDKRLEKPSPEAEREWCEIYARSHVVVGVHGSNMLLPSAHAASVIDLMPEGKWPNIYQDIILPDDTERTKSLRSLCVPIETRPKTLAIIVSSFLSRVPRRLKNLRNDPVARRADL